MQILFTKMQGCGNDYVYIDGFAHRLPDGEKPEFARRMSDRHFGIGADGVIFINPSEEADFEMEMYNADGSRGAMCGNGIRCVGKYVYDKGLTDRTEIQVISGGSRKLLTLFPKDGKVEQVRVNMGAPILEADKIPVRAEGGQVIAKPVSIGGREWKMTCISMGNPHAVVFAQPMEDLDLKGLEIEKIGPLFEHHEWFPDRVNTEFVRVVDSHRVQMRVWERGSGETLACGTGCCAVTAACVLNGLTGRRVTVEVLGGELEIEWDEKTNEIYMTGPAQTVFEGCVEYEGPQKG